MECFWLGGSIVVFSGRIVAGAVESRRLVRDKGVNNWGKTPSKYRILRTLRATVVVC